MSKKRKALEKALSEKPKKSSKQGMQPKPSKRRLISCNDAHIRNAIEMYLKSLSLIEDNEMVISYTQSIDMTNVEILLGREVTVK